jgi:hypothetical protein
MDLDIITLALSLTMGVAAGVLARVKGYSFFLWFIYGFFLSGIALFHAIRVRPRFQSEHGF